MSKPTTHSAAILHGVGRDLVVEERSTPSPGPGEVLVQTHAIGLNPIDWKRQSFGIFVSSFPVVLGADVCGIVVEVGPSVSELKPGDRVFGMADGFLTSNNDHAAHQEYTILKATSTALLPSKFSFRQGATLPTAVATATMGLFDALALPREPAGNANTGILIWGGASAVGSMAVQLARRAGLAVYTAASERHHTHLVKLGASFVVDYRARTAVEDLISAAVREGTGISCAIDAISTPETLPSVLRVLYTSSSTERKLAYTLPWPEDIDNPSGIEARRIIASEICSRREDLARWMCGDVLPKWLENDEIVPQEQKIIGGGLGGLQRALDSLRQGVSGEKVVVEVRRETLEL